MLKQEFKEIMDDEIAFHQKRFIGDDQEERERNKRKFMARYYESLCHLSKSQLTTAFQKCRENFDYFPKLNQLMKFSPIKREEEAYKEPVYTQPAPEVKARIDSALKRNKYKVGKDTLENNLAFCKARWPMSNWDGVLERWLEEDGHRIERPTNG